MRVNDNEFTPNSYCLKQFSGQPQFTNNTKTSETTQKIGAKLLNGIWFLTKNQYAHTAKTIIQSYCWRSEKQIYLTIKTNKKCEDEIKKTILKNTSQSRIMTIYLNIFTSANKRSHSTSQKVSNKIL